jgi:hypothetical protein
MKTARKFRIRLGSFMMMLLPLIYACISHDIEPVKDYFPLSQTAKTVYKKEFIFSSNEIIWTPDTVTLSVSRDTLIDGLTYKRIVNEYGMLEKVVRREGDKYFGRNHEAYGGFSKEYLFLDVSVPTGGTWEHIKDEGFNKTEYVVKETNATQLVNGVEYKDVIKIDVNYYSKYLDGVNFSLLYSAQHFYANGFGEIYAYYPAPVSGMFCDLNISMLPVSK